MAGLRSSGAAGARLPGDVVLPVGRLRAHGDAVELRTAELAMTRSEAAALVRLAGLELTQDQALALARRTEGWPAGLHLAALSLRDQGGERPSVDEFDGDGRLLGDYVREELLSGLPAAQLDVSSRGNAVDRARDAGLVGGGAGEP